jgi:prepilin-type N-terminal cleavage/methylation domain-containing protein
VLTATARPRRPNRRNPLNRLNRVEGFTLIEMMVVMVLLGLVSALTLPSMQRWHDAVQARAQMALVVESLRGAMFSAAARRQDVLVDPSSFVPVNRAAPASAANPNANPASSAAASTTTGTATGAATLAPNAGPERAKVALPDGWAVERVVDAMFMKSGLCRPGMALLRNPTGQRMVVQVSGPACSVDTLTDVPASLR